MKKFLTTIKNIWSIVELRDKILITLGYLVIFRLGSYIVLPGIDPDKLSKSAGGFFGLLDTFLGGAFSKASIFGLGIMPYISASIVIQLLTVAMPYFQKMQKEGESGRKKINQITRVLTIFICLSQSVAYIKGTIASDAIVINQTIFLFLAMIILTSGTIFCMWLGEKITDKGIGNGISMLIMIGIISRFPAQLIAEAVSKGLSGALLFILELVALFFVIMAVVALTQAVRKIPVQYAKRVVGRKVYGGQATHLPLKINSGGVIPPIFATSVIAIPSTLGSLFENEFMKGMSNQLSLGMPLYVLIYVAAIIFFCFFYVSIIFNPNEVADNIRKYGGYIPGIRPGRRTSEYIDRILSRLTLAGAIYLVLVCLLPEFLMSGFKVQPLPWIGPWLDDVLTSANMSWITTGLGDQS